MRQVLSIVLTVAAFAATAAGAQQVEPDALRRSQAQQSQQVGTVIHSSQIDRSQWASLTEADWERYDDIMKGPRRFWSPGVDPLTVLGAEARSDAERMRYAEMLVEQERDRAEKELAFTRAYGDAWIRMYGDEKLLDPVRLGIEQVIPFDMTDRIAIFMDTTCVACTNIIQQVLPHLQRAPWPGLDIYFADKEEERIQKWTAAAGIPYDMVESGRVTVNFEEGILAQLQGTDMPSYPVAYRRRGDSFSPVEMSYLLRADLYTTHDAAPATGTAGGGFLDRIRSLIP